MITDALATPSWKDAKGVATGDYGPNKGFLSRSEPWVSEVTLEEFNGIRFHP